MSDSTESVPGPAPATPAAKRGDLKKLVALTRFILPYKGRFATAMVALAVAASMVLAIGQGLKHVIDRGFSAADASTLDQTLVWLMLMLVVLGASTFTRYYLITWVGERFVADLRRAVFDHVLKLSPVFFETTRTGEVISRITNDTTLLDSVVGGAFSWALRNLVLLIGGMTMLFITSVKLTLLVMAGIPFVIAPILLLGRRVRKLARDMTDRVADATAFIDETLHEVRTVQAYGHEPVDRSRFAERIESVFRAATLKARFNATLIATVIVLAFGAIGVILWVGGHDVIAGRITAGELSAFVFYAVIVANAVNAVSEVYGELMRAAGASERLMEILNTQPAIEAPAQPQAFPAGGGNGDAATGRIDLERVEFFYPSRPERAALANFSLSVAAGERVALVGPSGAGKTTVFQLLSRFYDPQAGSVRIDGVELRQADPLAVRGRMAIVAQDPVIFAASVADNVRYGRPEANDEEVKAACEAAYAADFIARLPQGYDTYLGERGVRLSGGQRQRIAIARAFLANRSILLLDEATSALDAESERMVQLAMEKLMQNRTTVIIAHRLATVKSADRIVVMEEGRIVGQGTHESLVQAGGLYARLAALQFNTH